MIDTHSHMYAEEFDADRAEALQRAWDAGVERLILPDIDSESRERMFDLAKAYPEKCLPTAGLHPTSVNDNPRWQEELDMVERLLREPPMRLYAVGEIGLDLYWSSDFYAIQREVLHAQLELALAYNLPVIIHTRSAYTQMLDAVATYRGRGLRGVFHAYADSVDTAKKLGALGDFVFGIGGVVTFKNARQVREVAARVPHDRILVETDCPYLSPEPFRGRLNHSGRLCYTVQALANELGMEAERLTEVTYENACRLFGIH